MVTFHVTTQIEKGFGKGVNDEFEGQTVTG